MVGLYPMGTISDDDMKKVIKESKKSFNESDPFPIADVLDSPNFEDLVRIYSKITNLSLSSGIYPEYEKNGIVRPYYKGEGDPNTFKPYRPVTNIPFLGKVIECTVNSQLTEHLESVSAVSENQSAYRRNHSTESVVCAVVDDLLGVMDGGGTFLLLLLDLSAAFDMVHHPILLEDLRTMGVEGVVLDWFESYLSSRTYNVVIENKMSIRKDISRGVPQRSVLGPVLINHFVADSVFQLPPRVFRRRL